MATEKTDICDGSENFPIYLKDESMVEYIPESVSIELIYDFTLDALTWKVFM